MTEGASRPAISIRAWLWTRYGITVTHDPAGPKRAWLVIDLVTGTPIAAPMKHQWMACTLADRVALDMHREAKAAKRAKR